MQRLISVLIVAVLTTAASVRCDDAENATDDLSMVFAGTAFEGCAVLPTQKCVLMLATQVANNAEASDMASYLASVATARPAMRSIPDHLGVKGRFARGALEALARVAAAQAKAGLRDEAEATIKVIRQRLDRDRELLHVGVVQLAFVESLGNIREFDEALSFAGSEPTIANHLAHVGRLSEGLELLLWGSTFHRSDTIRRFAWATRYIALERGEEGLLIEAFRAAGQQEALLIVAQALAETGKFNEAWQLTLSARTDRQRAAALARIAILQIRAGGIAPCVRKLLAVEDTQLRTQILQQMLEGFLIGGALEKALSTGLDERVPLRPGGIAVTTSKDLAKVLNLVGALPHNQDRDLTLGIIVAAQMQSGASAEAWRTAQSIEDGEARYITFRLLGKIETSNEHRTEAKAAYEEAAATVKTLDCNRHRRPCTVDTALSPIASEMAQAGLVEEALRIVEALKAKYSAVPLNVLYSIAQAQAKLGAIDEALATARTLERDDRIYGLGTGIVAFELAKVGRIAEALIITRAQNSGWRNGTLRAVARERIEAGAYQQALQFIEELEGAKEKVFAFAAIGKIALQAGQRATANEMFARALHAAQTERPARAGLDSLLRIASSMDTEPMPIDFNMLWPWLP